MLDLLIKFHLTNGVRPLSFNPPKHLKRVLWFLMEGLKKRKIMTIKFLLPISSRNSKIYFYVLSVGFITFNKRQSSSRKRKILKKSKKSKNTVKRTLELCFLRSYNYRLQSCICDISLTHHKLKQIIISIKLKSYSSTKY